MSRVLWVCIVLCVGLIACGDDDGAADAGDGGADFDVAVDAPADGARADTAVDSDVDSSVMDSGSPDAAPPEECDAPGTSERVACGRCGEQVRFCTVSEVWEYGPCEDETGICTPGESDLSACGNCGSQEARCNTSCEWDPMGECTDEGECEPGERVRTPDGCGDGETRELLCADTCTFEESMMCENDECGAPGAIETVACGLCGTSERFCTTDRVWEYGACTDEGVCDPGTTEEIACGNCGTQTSRCDTECLWVPFGACTDEGECSPGGMRTTTAMCPPDEERIETCDDACTYVPAMCMPVDDACNMLDILLVVDDSGSMTEEIANLVTHAGEIISALDDYAVATGTLDWRLGVTTTSKNLTVTQELFPGFPPTITMDMGPDGALLMPDACAMARPYIRRGDADRADTLACLANVGTAGSAYEMPLLMVDHAVTDRVADGMNAGFFRADAMLGVIMITDEDDCSFPEDEVTVTVGVDVCDPAALVPVGDTVDALDAHKGRDAWATYTIAGPGPGVCMSVFGDAQDGVRLDAFTDVVPTNSEFASICAGDLLAPITNAIDHFYDVCTP